MTIVETSYFRTVTCRNPGSSAKLIDTFKKPKVSKIYRCELQIDEVDALLSFTVSTYYVYTGKI
jgi:hypothetical protein